MTTFYQQKKFKGIPEELWLVTELNMEDPTGNEWKFQVGYNGDTPIESEWFTVYVEEGNEATKIGSTNRLSKAIEIIAKYVQIQVVDEDDSFDKIVPKTTSELIDEDLNKIIVEIVEAAHEPKIYMAVGPID